MHSFSILLLLLILAPAAAFSQSSTISFGVLQLPWGASPDSIRTFMASLDGVSLVNDTTDGTQSTITYRGGIYNAQPVQRWEFICDEQGLQMASIVIDTQLVAGSFERYRNLLDSTRAQFGRPDQGASAREKQYFRDLTGGKIVRVFKAAGEGSFEQVWETKTRDGHYRVVVSVSLDRGLRVNYLSQATAAP